MDYATDFTHEIGSTEINSDIASTKPFPLDGKGDTLPEEKVQPEKEVKCPPPAIVNGILGKRPITSNPSSSESANNEVKIEPLSVLDLDVSSPIPALQSVHVNVNKHSKLVTPFSSYVSSLDFTHSQDLFHLRISFVNGHFLVREIQKGKIHLQTIQKGGGDKGLIKVRFSANGLINAKFIGRLSTNEIKFRLIAANKRIILRLGRDWFVD